MPHDGVGLRHAVRDSRVALGAVVLLAAILRVHYAATFPFEQDELYTRVESGLLLQSTLPPGTTARPLFFLMMHPLLAFLPEGELGLRLPALLFGVLGVGGTLLLGHRVAGAWGGVVAGVMAALSPWHLHVSAMARYWSAVYLLVTVAAWLLLGLRQRAAAGTLAVLGTVVVVGGLTHPTFLMTTVGAALGAYAVGDDGRWRFPFPWRSHVARLWFPAAALIVGTVITLRAISPHFTDPAHGRGLLASLQLVPAMAEWVSPTIAVGGVLGALLLAGSVETSHRRFGAMSLGAFLTTTLLLLLASFRAPVWTDYGIGVLPFLYVSVAGLLLGFERSPRGLYSRAALTLVLVAGVLPSTVSALIDGTRFDYRPAFSAIRKASPHRLALVRPLILQQEYAPDLSAVEIQARRAFLDSVLAAHDSVWAVVSRQRQSLASDPSGELRDWLAARCRLGGEWGRQRLDYREYTVLLYACGQSTTSSTAPRSHP